MRIGRCTLLPWRTRPCSSSWPRSTPQSRQRSRPESSATQALHLQETLPQGSNKSTFMATPFAVCGRSAHVAHAWPCFANVCVKTDPPQSETLAAQSLSIAVLSVAVLLSHSHSAFRQGAQPAQGAPVPPPRPVAKGSTTTRPPKMTVLKPGQVYVCPPGYKICFCNPGGNSGCCLENSACVCENAVSDCR